MPCHDIPYDGLTFHCQIDGPEGAPWVVLSNFLLTNLTLWVPQLATVAACRILRYDQRGHGRTGVPPTPTTIGQLAGDAAALMAHFGVQDATFVGASLGAATGLCLAARHEPRIARLLAAGGNPATPPGGSQAWDERIALARAHGMEALAEATLARWFAAPSLASAHPALPAVRAMIERTPLDGFVARALQAYDLGPALPGIRIPTTLVAGADDSLLPQTLRAAADRITGARLHVIGGAGHLPNVEQPAVFNAILRSILP